MSCKKHEVTKETLLDGRQSKRRLTAKQWAFVEHYCSAAVNLNATEAARRAGYKGNDNTLGTVASQNMQKPAIREKIDSRLKMATAGANVTVERILWELQATYERATQDRKYSAAVRCLELQGKYLKMFSDRIEHVQSIESCSTEELISLLREVVANSGFDFVDLLGSTN